MESFDRKRHGDMLKALETRRRNVTAAIADMIARGELTPLHHGHIIVYDHDGAVTQILTPREFEENFPTMADEGRAVGSMPFIYPSQT